MCAVTGTRKDGSRHLLKVEPLKLSGWVTMQKDGVDMLERRGDNGAESPSPPEEKADAKPDARQHGIVARRLGAGEVWGVK